MADIIEITDMHNPIVRRAVRISQIRAVELVPGCVGWNPDVHGFHLRVYLHAGRMDFSWTFEFADKAEAGKWFDALTKTDA